MEYWRPHQNVIPAWDLREYENFNICLWPEWKAIIVQMHVKSALIFMVGLLEDNAEAKQRFIYITLDMKCSCTARGEKEEKSLFLYASFCRSRITVMICSVWWREHSGVYSFGIVSNHMYISDKTAHFGSTPPREFISWIILLLIYACQWQQLVLQN